jgi:type II secretory pathway pseudopilin PulG
MGAIFKKSLRKGCFTLLELIIVLFIISMGIVLTGVKVKDVFQEQRFLSQSQQVLNHLAMAQDLMLIMDADVQVKIDLKSKDLQIWLEIEKPLNGPSARLIERKIPLTAIHSFEFDESREKELTLLFSLGRMSKGTLTLYEGEHSDKREFAIQLRGYPTSFRANGKEVKDENQVGKSQLLYPEEVYEQLYAKTNKEKKGS